MNNQLLKRYANKLIFECNLDVRLLLDDDELIEFLVNKLGDFGDTIVGLEGEIDRLEGTVEDLESDIEDLRDKLDTNLY